MSDSTYGPKVYKTANGDALIVADGGYVDVESGGELRINGTDAADVLAAGVAGVAAGYKIARGEATLDGGNPTSVTTGLATIVAAVACIKSASALGDDPVAVSVDYGGSVAAGQLDLYAWKTDGSDPTLIASTNNAAVVAWIAVGT